MKIKVLGMFENRGGEHDLARRVYDAGFLCPCLNAHSGDTIPKILVEIKDEN